MTGQGLITDNTNVKGRDLLSSGHTTAPAILLKYIKHQQIRPTVGEGVLVDLDQLDSPAPAPS